MKFIKNPIILIISLAILTIITTILFVLLTYAGGEFITNMVLDGIPAIFAAMLLRIVYTKITKEAMHWKTKLIIVITYFVIQQILGIILNVFMFPSEDLMITLGIQFIIQAIYSLIIYICLT